ncbi:MAG TPA: RNA polymerase sigma factor [Candidatus Sumerlaeota bacterium]|jgi:RNA polymerase sigma-70 factor (ECF subfamily)|nr:RNA polymerase sigma factor [Candidatus Sumerlaeota bacterium]
MEGPQSSTDEALIQAVLAGNKDAFGPLAQRHTPRLFGLAFHLCRDYDTAADLTQETLVAAYEALDRVRDRDAFPAWLAGILRNKFRNLGRYECRRPTLSLDELREAGFDPRAPDSAHPGRAAEQREVWQALEGLAPQHREVLLMRYSDDLSYDDIARYLDLPVTTVTSRLGHARKALIQRAKEMGLL